MSDTARFVRLNLAEVAWAAGFLDGEGYFGADERRLSIEAAQVATDAPLRRLHGLFGGSLSQRRDTPRRRGAHIWRLASPPGVRNALLALTPFLVVKQAQAQHLLMAAMTFVGRHGTAPDEPALAIRAYATNQLLAERRGTG